MDFFSNRPDPPDSTDNTHTFAKAVLDRSVSNPLFTPAALNPPTTTASPIPLVPSAAFPSLDPDKLQELLSSPGVLCIDIRPHAAYTLARIPNALSLSVPSTLLKRPLFSLERLLQMLPSPAARNRFSQWKKATTIVVYDVDSAGSSAGPLPEGNNILGLLRKFATDSSGGTTYSGQLFWLKGGFQRVWREKRSLVDVGDPETELEDDDPALSLAPSAPSAPALRPQHLSITAFGSTSTTVSLPRKLPTSTLSASRGNALSLHNQTPTTPPLPVNPFFDTIRQNVELSHGVTERIPLRLPKRVRHRLNELPFDWLKEIGRRSDLKCDDSDDPDVIIVSKRVDPTPSRARPITPPDPALVDAGMEALAMQFYRIELAEQRRLIGVMQHHSKESDGPALRKNTSNSESTSSRDSLEDDDGDVQMRGSTSPKSPGSSTLWKNEKEDGKKKKQKKKQKKATSSPQEDKQLFGNLGGSKKLDTRPFPYSITAGVEKGAKNRYRHIWPFEHARVRLHQRRSPPASSYPPFFASASTSSLPLSSTAASNSFHLHLPFSIRPPSGALTGPISSFPLMRSFSASPRGRNKPTGLGLTAKPSFTFGASSSFTQMQQRAGPGSGSGGEETTESEQEHEDVHGSGTEHDDYVNASYVQPLCTRKRYIATQGPLEATFTDFWTLVYQQNVHVIVMLTREIEGSMIKCGPYWKGEVFGPLRLRLSHVEGREEEGRDDSVKKDAGGFFNLQDSQPDPKSADSIIKRVFHLSHTSYPHLPPRKVVQLQYLGWPDMNVPDDPRGVLTLIQEVDRAVEDATFLDGEVEYDEQALNTPSGRSKLPRSASDEALDRNTGIAKHALGRKHAPVLLHCSAGVGRTGGFIAIDAVLDGIRREVRKNVENMRADVPATPMEVDLPKDVDGAFGPFKTIAIATKHSGDILHVPVHNGSSNSRSVSDVSDLRKTIVGLQADDITTPPARVSPTQVLTKSAVEEPALRSPVHNAASKRLKEEASTRMWAEDVSDQTGHHGRAKRVEQARRESHSQSRLSELDHVPQLKDASSGTGDDNWSSHADCESTHSRPIDSPPYEFPSSVEESTSNSGDSFGFKHHLSKHSGLPLSSSSGTSLSSLRSATKHLKSAHRDESRLRTWSAPLSGHDVILSSGVSSGGDKGVTSDMEISRPASSAKGEARTLQDSPSPLGTSGDRGTPSAPGLLSPSRSLSPSGTGSGGSSSIDRLSAPPSGDDGSNADKSSSNSGSGSVPQSSSASDLMSVSAPIAAIAAAPRAVVQVSYDQPLSVAKSLSMPTANSTMISGHRLQPLDMKNVGKTPRASFDYAQPRTLHGDQSPKSLSDYEEPLWEVLQDMREQRMSLCQSLRQYVFVHAAVIEGALMVMDEEWERVKAGSTTSAKAEPPTSCVMHLHKNSGSSIPTITTSTASTTGKRVASPTELPKEDKKGGRLLFKKPSLKRKGGGSSDESLDSPAKSKEDLDTNATLFHPPPVSMS